MVKEVEENIYLIDNPYAQNLLTIVRDKSTPYHVFRRILEELGFIVGVEISHSLPTYEVKVETPLGVKAKGLRLISDERIILMAIMRASLPFIWGLLKAYPKARLGVIVARRIEETKRFDEKGMLFDVEISYQKLPTIDNNDIVVVADPMVATGSTISRILWDVKKSKPLKVIVASIITTEHAINRIKSVYPETIFYTLSIDNELNENGFIVPGLGDAGDRSFGTS